MSSDFRPSLGFYNLAPQILKSCYLVEGRFKKFQTLLHRVAQVGVALVQYSVSNLSFKRHIFQKEIRRYKTFVALSHKN